MENNIAQKLAHSKDSLIRDTISACLGTKDWRLSEVASRGHFTTYPNGTEIFSFDGIDFIEFHRYEIETERAGYTTVINASFQYRWLTEIKLLDPASPV